MPWASQISEILRTRRGVGGRGKTAANLARDFDMLDSSEVERRRHLANALIGTILGEFDAPIQFWPTLPPRASAFSCFSYLRSHDTLAIVTIELSLVPVMAIIDGLIG